MSTSFSPLTTPGSSSQELPILPEKQQTYCWAAIVALVVVLVVVYLDTLMRVAGVWDSPQYSHGFLIPVFAAALLAIRRKPFRQVPMWHRWVGVGLIAFGVAMRSFGAFTVIFVADNLSFIPCVLGVFVLVGGLPTLKWAGPAVLFLIFMYPFPRVLEERVMHPLQQLATICSNMLLVTLGVDSIREGNSIHLATREQALNVAEQCSGLRMLTIFTALAVAMALIFTDRPWWERGIIMLSAIPIALAVNVFRITLTGLLYSFGAGEELADTVFHDFAGWIMMPMALGLLYLEIYLLGKIFVDAPQEATRLNVSPVKMNV